ncbi:MAG: hypothetical protein U9P80_08175, partial [Thermodesulfobacteriota bacterium]|nr:hypothetical protein [Thermodesulfobacteriota bacterium]
GGTGEEISGISHIIDDVNDMVSTIATAVDEQSVTTKEIAGNITQASQGIQEVTENVAQSSTVAGEIAKDIAEVNQSATEMSNSSSQVDSSAGDLNSLAGQLMKMVNVFKVGEAVSECELLAKCGFFKKHKDETLNQIIVDQYCRGPKQGQCKRKEYRNEHGVPPSDDMDPAGKLIG